MENPGKYLREERENRHLSLSDVSRSTRIQVNTLRAIEDGRLEELPHPFYVKAFLTTYARHLGLNPTDVFQEEKREAVKTSDLPSMRPVLLPKRRRARWQLIPLIGVVILLCFIGAYYAVDPIGRAYRLLSEEQTVVPHVASIAPTAAKLIPSDDPFPQAGVRDLAPGPGVSADPRPCFHIAESALGKELEAEGGVLRLTGRSSQFPCNEQRIYFLTRTEGKPEGKLTHVWSWKGREFYRLEIDIRPPTRSVYSYLILRPNQVGDWAVEVRDGDTILNRLTFTAVPPDTYS
jgi:hypothetical protein